MTEERAVPGTATKAKLDEQHVIETWSDEKFERLSADREAYEEEVRRALGRST